MSNELTNGADKPIVLTRTIKPVLTSHAQVWKVAYADFVTAMMAFFLLLWLLSTTTEEQMLGVSDFFAPPVESEHTEGLGEAFSGLTLQLDQNLRSAPDRPSTTVVLPSFGDEESGEETGEDRENEQLQVIGRTRRVDEAVREEEARKLDQVAAKLQQSVLENPEMQELQDSLLFDVVDDGLQIQVMDQNNLGMFIPGTAELTRRAVRLLALIGSIVAPLPNNLVLTGHTNRTPPRNARLEYTNWELSGDRAVSTRKWLVDAGIAAERISHIAGMGDSELLDTLNPESARNQRVSILIVRQEPDNVIPQAITDDDGN